MELRHLRYFIAVAEELNFTRAARRVGIGQPPLSNQIRDLENEIGTALFRRLPNGAELTEAGKAFLPEVRAILFQAEQAKRSAIRAARGESGRLRVGFTSSAVFNPLVPAAVNAFREKYADVEFSLEEAPTTRLLEQLDVEELDAVFVRPGSGDQMKARCHLLAEERMVIALPSRDPRSEAEALRLDEVAEESFVLFPREAGTGFFDDIIAACRQAGFEPILGQLAPQITSIPSLIAVGLGVSIVPAEMVKINVPGVRYIAIEGEAPKARLTLATRRDERSPIVRNFLTQALGVKPSLASQGQFGE
ncbi:DNA-binding transcriptional LysR family regulator [Rhizobium sp. BK650]|uniref:LysR family transcriptional regulator n=1 Tax=Rhizobium sp. BK650 TaxID=2586990 RepID=UPI00161E10F3|nr:LysR family transcriptional regulator [Rhizobium sp. BK650]MBB3656051.1 DNA-binding transcriptional LysR family regulator [Rhizobium sp. BK650]